MNNTGNIIYSAMCRKTNLRVRLSDVQGKRRRIIAEIERIDSLTSASLSFVDIDLRSCGCAVASNAWVISCHRTALSDIHKWRLYLDKLDVREERLFAKIERCDVTIVRARRRGKKGR
jgi:hypothetical protein